MALRPCRSLTLAAALLFALASPEPARAQADALRDANQLFRQGQYDRALERVNAHLKSQPKDARARFLQGLILTEQNRGEEAIKVFTALTHDFPELPEPHNNLAVLYAAQGQYDKAQTALEMAIRTHPSYATAHENLGDIYAKRASQAYDKALQLDRANRSAQTKLNLIRELFSSSPKPVAGARTGEKPAAPSPEPAPKQQRAQAPEPAATAGARPSESRRSRQGPP
jgi:tetratricopeptide (TPR) repeat protein